MHNGGHFVSASVCKFKYIKYIGLLLLYLDKDYYGIFQSHKCGTSSNHEIYHTDNYVVHQGLV